MEILLENLENLTKYVYQKNNLTPSTKVKNCIDAVTNSCGLHSARIQSPYVALLSRVENFKVQDLNESLFTKKEFIKHRNVRTTLHLVSFEMLPHFHEVTLNQKIQALRLFFKKNLIADRDINVIETQLEQTCDKCYYSSNELEEIIKKLITDYNLNIDNNSITCRKIIKYLCEIGVLYYANISKNWLKEERKYVVSKQFFENYNLKNGDISFFVNRYFKNFGPASLKDFSWWSGLSQNVALQVINSNNNYIKLVYNDIDLYMLKEDYDNFLHTNIDTNYINLLAWEESVIKAYKETRFRFVSDKNYNKLFNIIGEARCSILYNGQIVGVWEYDKKTQRINTKLFDKQDKNFAKELDKIITHYEKVLKISNLQKGKNEQRESNYR